MTEIKFYKYNGTGNDFIILDGAYKNKLTNENIIKLCDRNFGIGADGILFIDKSLSADYKMTIYNSDASIAKMCGNGIRCFAKHLIYNKLSDKKEINIETDSGIKKAIIYENEIEIDMGKASFEDNDLFTKSYINEYYDYFNEKITTVSVGNPHTVIFREDKADKKDILNIAPKYISAPIFKDSTNLELVNIKNDFELDVLVFERGAGLTLACGTGACAVVSAFSNINKNIFNKWIKINLLGGSLKVMLKENLDLKLKGGANFVYYGYFNIHNI